jgi:methylmalonyl-CoA mutase
MSDLQIAQQFPRASDDQWRDLVNRVLKGGDAGRLVVRTLDGFSIEPLYARRTTPEGHGAAPGHIPFVRGTGVAANQARWDIRQLYEETDPARANVAVRDDLTGGVTSIALAIAAPGLFGLPYGQADIAEAVEGVMLEVCPIHLVAGEYTPDAAGSLMSIWRNAGLSPERWRGGFGYDPLGTLARTGALYHPLPRALQIAADLIGTTRGSPHVTALGANGHLWHSGGATEAQELAAVLANVVELLRASERTGIGPSEALPKIAITLATDADQFLSIAKLRAARKLLWRIAEACGAGSAAASVVLAAETSDRMLTRRDPWVNLLRNTVACSAAALGGADSIMVLPFTRALGQPDAFARRMARNTHHVLMEESALDRVCDPTGGSWYVEQLTTNLAATAWTVFQSIEERGGLGTALTSGWWQDELARSAEARAKLIANGRAAVTGTSAFPKLGDDGVTATPWPTDRPSADLNGARARPLVLQRSSEPFEALRDAADAFQHRSEKPPMVFLASLGPLAAHSTRTTWMRNFLAAGGIETTVSDGYSSSAEVGLAFAASGCAVACLCSTDEVYAELGEATASLLKSAGCRRLYLAGRPKEHEAELRASGVDAFIYAGIDAIAALRELHVTLGVGGDGHA